MLAAIARIAAIAALPGCASAGDCLHDGGDLAGVVQAHVVAGVGCCEGSAFGPAGRDPSGDDTSARRCSTESG